MYAYRQFNTSMYALKRQYGRQVTVITETGKAVDYETGGLTKTLTQYVIKHVLVAPPSFLRGHLAPSVGSGVSELSCDLVVIFDWADLPTVNESSTNWIFVIDGASYSVVKMSPLSIGSPVQFLLKSIGGQL